MKKIRRLLAVLLAIGMLCTLLSACGGDNPPAESGDPGGQTGTNTGSAEGDKSDWVQLHLTYATFLAADAPGQDGIDLLQAKCDEYMGEGYITTVRSVGYKMG